MKQRAAMKPMIVLVALAAALAAGCASRQTATGAVPARVEVAVTDAGFVPATIQVPRGKPVTLVVTRQVEQTCATGIVVAKPEIHADLPLNQPVEVTFTPQGDEVDFSCPMHMISGKVTVR